MLYLFPESLLPQRKHRDGTGGRKEAVRMTLKECVGPGLTHLVLCDPEKVNPASLEGLVLTSVEG